MLGDVGGTVPGGTGARGTSAGLKTLMSFRGLDENPPRLKCIQCRPKPLSPRECYSGDVESSNQRRNQDFAQGGAKSRFQIVTGVRSAAVKTQFITHHTEQVQTYKQLRQK